MQSNSATQTSAGDTKERLAEVGDTSVHDDDAKKRGPNEVGKPSQHIADKLGGFDAVSEPSQRIDDPSEPNSDATAN